MTNLSTSPVKQHRLSLSTPPKLLSYCQNVVFTVSALLLFALFMYIGSDDEMLMRAQNSFRVRQQRLAARGQPEATDTNSTSTPTPVSLINSDSNVTDTELEFDDVGVTGDPENIPDSVIVPSPESSRGVSTLAPERSVVGGTPAPAASEAPRYYFEDALAPEFRKVKDPPAPTSQPQVNQYDVGISPIPDVREGDDRSCDGRRIYMYKLPAEFNELIGKECENWIFSYWIMCEDLYNHGLGRQLNLSEDGVASRLLQPPSGWYKTDQFALEVIFHHRVKAYPCLTDDPERASLFYAPFYHTLDVTRNLYNSDLALRDHVSDRFVAWLVKQRAWELTHGKRHIIVLGRIMWDFLRSPSGKWGSSLLSRPELQNVTSFLIERVVSKPDSVAIPYPTNFHPASDAELTSWQSTVRRANRTQFVSFAGSSRGRNMTTMVRGALFTQCANSPRCKHLICTHKLCGEKVETIYKLALESVFCLQPAGDSPTRKGIFDTLLSGCIPVLFNPNQGVDQYLYHLKGNGSDYSVLMDGRAVIYDHYDVVAHLERIPKSEVERLQANIIQLLPSLLYRNPTLTGTYTSKDAFDVTIDSVLERFSKLDAAGSTS